MSAGYAEQNARKLHRRCRSGEKKRIETTTEPVVEMSIHWKARTRPVQASKPTKKNHTKLTETELNWTKRIEHTKWLEESGHNCFGAPAREKESTMTNCKSPKTGKTLMVCYKRWHGGLYGFRVNCHTQYTGNIVAFSRSRFRSRSLRLASNSVIWSENQISVTVLLSCVAGRAWLGLQVHCHRRCRRRYSHLQCAVCLLQDLTIRIYSFSQKFYSFHFLWTFVPFLQDFLWIDWLVVPLVFFCRFAFSRFLSTSYSSYFSFCSVFIGWFFTGQTRRMCIVHYSLKTL